MTQNAYLAKTLGVKRRQRFGRQGGFAGGILFDPLGEGRFGYVVFPAELGLFFTILIKGDKGFFKIFIIFALSCYVNTSFWCLHYCNE